MMHKDKLMQLVANPANLQQEDLQELKALVSDYPYCQTFQMLYAKCLSGCDKLAFDEQLARVALSVNRIQLFYLINDQYNEKKEEKPTVEELPVAVGDYFSYLEAETNNNTPKDKTNELIDSFIRKKEKIKFVVEKDEQNLPERPEEDEYFSETLAKIYIKQKKYDKAIKIFEKLSLKYPEKSIYFADQIRFLTIIVNNKK